MKFKVTAKKGQQDNYSKAARAKDSYTHHTGERMQSLSSRMMTKTVGQWDEEEKINVTALAEPSREQAHCV